MAISVLNAKGTDTDQTPRSAASDPDLHRLPVSILWDARNKRVNNERKKFNFRCIYETKNASAAIAHSKVRVILRLQL